MAATQVQKLLLLVITLLLSACGVQLRVPFCESYLSEVPQEFLGSYEIIAANTSAEWSNNTVIERLAVEVTPQSFGVSTGSDQATSPTGMCQYNKRFFMESENSNGTYGLYEISTFQHGLILGFFSLDVKQSQKNGFPLIYLPSVDFRTGFSLNLNLNQMQEYILDNRALSQDQVLKVMKPLMYQSMLRTSSISKQSLRKYRITPATK